MADLGLTHAATLAVWAAGLYLACGALFALIFVTALMARLDPVARRAPMVLRLVALPAAAVLWPWLAVKLLFRADR